MVGVPSQLPPAREGPIPPSFQALCSWGAPPRSSWTPKAQLSIGTTAQYCPPAISTAPVLPLLIGSQLSLLIGVVLSCRSRSSISLSPVPTFWRNSLSSAFQITMVRQCCLANTSKVCLLPQA